MIKMRTTTILISIFVLIASCSKKKQNELIVGKPIPEFELLDNYGNIVKLSDFRGKILLIDFWASWCGPCIQLSEKLLKPLSESIDSTRFAILSISTDKDLDKWNEAVKSEGLKWTQVCLTLNENEAYLDYQIEYLPTTFLVDEKGCLIGKLSTKEEIIEKLTAALNTDTIIINKEDIVKSTDKFIDPKDYVDNMIFNTEQFIYENTNYPTEAKANNIQDSVQIILAIGKEYKLEFNGFIEYDALSMIRKDSIGYGCDEEMQRVFNLLKDWKSFDHYEEGTFSIVIPFYFPPRKPKRIES
jgi:thiol-disulfide isomerase/thioredoxin